MDCNSPGSSVHRIFQARILEWVAISFSRGFSKPRDETHVSCIAGRFLTNCFIWEAHKIVVQFSSVTQSCPTLCDPMDYSIPGFAILTTSWSLLRFMSIESGMLSNYLILCCPLLFLPSIFPDIRVFSNESILRIRWPKYCSFSFSISPSNKYSGLISFRIDWFELLAVQGTLKSLLQHHS